MELPDLVKACDLFVYLNVQFRSFSIRRRRTRSSKYLRRKYSSIPWTAVIPGLVVLASMAAATSIIVISNNQTVVSWKVGPATLLALLSSVLNHALSTALYTSVEKRCSVASACSPTGRPLSGIHCRDGNRYPIAKPLGPDDHLVFFS